jgi:nucleotide-binding universal stress UspA family protein
VRGGVVVGVSIDGRDGAALEFALQEAVRRRLALQVLHAYEVGLVEELPTALFPSTIERARRAAETGAAAALAAAVTRVPGARTVAAQAVAVEGAAAHVLLAAAQDAALLVVGRRKANAFVQAVLGSVSAACLRHASAPVAVVPAQVLAVRDRWLSSRVVVGVDGSAAAEAALDWGIAQAREWGCVLTPVLVLPAHADEGATRLLLSQVQEQLSEAGASDVEARVQILTGSPTLELLRELRPEDLLVLGGRDHGRLMEVVVGSTTQEIARSSPCPVVVVRPGQVRRQVARAGSLSKPEW